MGGLGVTALTNCISEANLYGFYNTFAREVYINCATYNNTTAAYHTVGANLQLNCVEGTTGSFFTNAATGDFTLNNTADCGALLRGTGFPGTFLNASVGYSDIGLFQHEDAGGATGGGRRTRARLHGV